MITLLDHRPQDDVQIPEDIYVGEREIEDLALEMHHQHLPHLEQKGFVEWDQEEALVEKGPNFEEIRPILELFVDNRDELPVEWP